MIWMISANGKMYDHASSFATNGFIDWRQRAKYSVGDIVYIYCTRPFKKVMYKCEVVKHSMLFSQCIDDAVFWIDKDEYEKSKDGYYARMKLLEQVDTEHLSLDNLMDKGLNAAPQGPIKLNPELQRYIDRYFDDFYADGFYPDVDTKKDYYEGHTKSIMVDVYERSSVARGKCIEYHGESCLICGVNFGEKYGEIGKGFIHVHHMRPLHTIRKEYIVNYKNDLIPVCPNCHAMIHRLPNGENKGVEQIKQGLLHIEQATKNSKPMPKDSAVTEQVKMQSSKGKVEEKASVKNIMTSTNLSFVKSGVLVKHKIFGEGVIIEINTEQKHIVISFAVGEKVFVIPDAFDKGFLQIENNDSLP